MGIEQSFTQYLSLAELGLEGVSTTSVYSTQNKDGGSIVKKELRNSYLIQMTCIKR